MNIKNAWTVAAACALVAACGGGGGGGNAGVAGDSVASEGVPQSALVSVGALVTYMKQLIARPDDSAEPLTLGDITLPVDDTVEPAAL